MKTKSKFYLKKLSLLAAILAFTLNAYAGNGNDKTNKPNGKQWQSVIMMVLELVLTGTYW